jgi:hypothetical protein
MTRRQKRTCADSFHARLRPPDGRPHRCPYGERTTVRAERSSVGSKPGSAADRPEPPRPGCHLEHSARTVARGAAGILWGLSGSHRKGMIDIRSRMVMVVRGPGQVRS